MNTTKLPYIVIWQAFGAKSEVVCIVSKHPTLDAAERECAELQRNFLSKWPKPTEPRCGDYIVIPSDVQ
jgi:hypothetical protein